VADPYNLGKGWVAFDYRAAFQRPVKIINDAAMQALGSYRCGLMLFLGLGTGLGSAMIMNGLLEPMELAHLPYQKGHVRGLCRDSRFGKVWEGEMAKIRRGRSGTIDRRP